MGPTYEIFLDVMNFGSQYFTNCATVAGIWMPATVTQLVKYCDPKFIKMEM